MHISYQYIWKGYRSKSVTFLKSVSHVVLTNTRDKTVDSLRPQSCIQYQSKILESYSNGRYVTTWQRMSKFDEFNATIELLSLSLSDMKTFNSLHTG